MSLKKVTKTKVETDQKKRIQMRAEYMIMSNVLFSTKYYDFKVIKTKKELDLYKIKDFVTDKLITNIKSVLAKKEILRLSMSMRGRYAKVGVEGQPIEDSQFYSDVVGNMKTLYKRDLRGEKIDIIVELYIEELINKVIKNVDATYGIALENIINITLNLADSTLYAGGCFPVGYSLQRGTLRNHVSIPRNTKDSLCFFYCLFLELNQVEVSRNKFYKEMDILNFENWMEANELYDFVCRTAGRDYFDIDSIEKVEERLEININLYTCIQDDPVYIEIYYRSAFLQPTTFNLCYIGYNLFYKCSYGDTKNNSKDNIDLEDALLKINPDEDLFEINKAAALEIYVDEQLQHKQTKRKNNYQLIKGHYTVFDTSYFKNKGYSSSNCRYCQKEFRLIDGFNSKIEKHEKDCLMYHNSTKDSTKRTIEFKETEGKIRQFDAMCARFFTPFAVYDFETIQDENGKHVAFSYSIIFVNIFSIEKSKMIMFHHANEEELLKQFVIDCKIVMNMYYDMQNVTEYTKGVLDIEKNCVLCETPLKTPFFAPKEKVLKQPLAKKLKKDGTARAPVVRKPKLDQDGNPILPKVKVPYIHNPYHWNHSHFEGDTLNTSICGYTHSGCNQRAQIMKQPLMMYAHNSKKFDNSFSIYAFMTYCQEPKQTNVLAKSANSFTKVVFTYNTRAISFSDSIMLMAGSLDSLVASSLQPHKSITDPKTREAIIEKHFKITKNFIKELYPANWKEMYELAQTKGVFPYTKLTVDSLTKKDNFEQEDYFNDLINKGCSDEDYEISNKVIKALKRSDNTYSFLDYHNFYLLVDVCLLADLLVEFSNRMYTAGGINPIQMISISSYAMQTWYFMSKEKIVLPPVNTAIQMKKSIVGGFSMIGNRYSVYHPDSKFFYLDFSSLYANSLRFKAPYKFVATIYPKAEENNYVYLDEYNEFSKLVKPDWSTDATTLKTILDDDSDEFTYFVELDCEALERQYHKRNSIYPLFPTNTLITEDMLTHRVIDKIKAENGGEFKPVMKAIPSFYKKEGLIINRCLIKKAMELGYKFSNVKRIDIFTKKHILKGFLDKFIQYKIEAKDENSRSAAKTILTNHYGGNIINVNNYNNIEVINNKSRLKKILASPNLKSTFTVGENVIANSHIVECEYRYTNAIGTEVLLQSKLLNINYIYKFYDILMNNYGFKHEDFKFHMCDTDSIAFSINNFNKITAFKTKSEFLNDLNVNQDFNVHDLSNVPGEFKNDLLKGVCGSMKDEFPQHETAEFVGICAKVYALKFDLSPEQIAAKEEEECRKSKGIKRYLIKQELTFDRYMQVARDEIDFENTVEYKEFKKKDFDINTINSKKKMFTTYDLKTITLHRELEDTRPTYLIHGHYKSASYIRNDNLRYAEELAKRD